MTLRFRVSTRSALGRRLKPLDGSERRDLFQQVVEAGLRALSAESARGDLEANLDRLFEEVNSQKKELAAIATHTERLVELACALLQLIRRRRGRHRLGISDAGRNPGFDRSGPAGA